MEIKKAIHLLYVPTMFCNMACKYCYLGNDTNVKLNQNSAITTLEYAIKKFLDKGYLPFNLSFHGGEVTTLSTETLEKLFIFTKDYYKKYKVEITSMGYKINPIHIKTNLFNLEKHIEILKKYEVSISGSVDLPLFLHKKYRVDKKGHSTLKKIKNNLKLLADYPFNKKISCVVTKEHLKYIDKFIEDIKYIHYDIGLDMTKFNIMFSFDSSKNTDKFETKIPGTEMLNHDEQVIFYKKIMQAFKDSELDYGLKTHWFKEFTPAFCCSASNCGNKFFLLQSDGNVYSCPRGQASKEYYYGNIFKNDIDKIVNSGWKIIEANENKLDIHDDCLKCEYFPYCNLGCTFVRTETQTNKSYTCKLQKEIYKNNKDLYPPFEQEYLDNYIKSYIYRNKFKKLKQLENYTEKVFNITSELNDEKNSIHKIIEGDEILKKIYSNELFSLEVDNQIYKLSSQILKNKSDIIFISEKTNINLLVNKEVFAINSKKGNEVNNYLLISALRNTQVIYGDEGRTKQEHLFDYSVYKNSFISFSKENEDYYSFNLNNIFKIHKKLFLNDVRNNLFITTKTMREYHYSKHKKNAFYHIQAINIPFANIEFYWIHNEAQK